MRFAVFNLHNPTYHILVVATVDYVFTTVAVCCNVGLRRLKTPVFLL